MRGIEEHNGSNSEGVELYLGIGSAAIQEFSLSDIEHVELSPSWRKITLGESSGVIIAFFTVRSTSRILQIEKCVCIGDEELATASACGHAAKVYSRVSITTIDNLQNLLSTVDRLHVCQGQDAQGSSCCKSRKCKVLSLKATYVFCHSQKKRMQGAASRKKQRQVQIQKNMKNLKRKAMRAAAARIAFLDNIKKLKEQLSAKDSVQLKEALGSLPPVQQVAFETSLLFPLGLRPRSRLAWWVLQEPRRGMLGALL